MGAVRLGAVTKLPPRMGTWFLLEVGAVGLVLVAIDFKGDVAGCLLCLAAVEELTRQQRWRRRSSFMMAMASYAGHSDDFHGM